MRVANYLGIGLLAALSALGMEYRSREAQSRRLEQALRSYSIPSAPTGFAVLFRVDSEDGRPERVATAYAALREAGFPAENIVVLAKDGKPDDAHPVTGAATARNLEQALESMATRVREQDAFVFYAANHGARTLCGKAPSSRPCTALTSRSGIVTEDTLMSYVSRIDASFQLGVFGLCYADGFASSFASATRLGVASASAAYQRLPPLDGKAESRQGDSFDVFFWRGMRGERAADANRDGRVSVGEAVDYARSKHTESRTGRQLPVTAGRPDPYRAFLPRM